MVAATFEELSRVGYAAMRVEDIAARSGVNKTTIYRRWPTKAELLTNAVMVHAERRLPPIDTGSVRGDLRASLLSAFQLRPYEQGVLRAIQMERSLQDVEAFAQHMREQLHDLRVAMVKRGIERGELPRNVDVGLVVDILSAPVQRALLVNESMDAAAIDRLLDVVLAGAVADAAARAAEKQRVRVTNRSAKGARRAKKR